MKRLVLALLLCLLATSVEAANRFARCATTCTWDNSSTAMWSTTSGGGTGASAPTSTDAVFFDGATCTGGTTCTTTVNANLNIFSLTMGACTASTTGCIIDFSVNNNTVAMTGLSISGTGVRTLKMGSNTWTITVSGLMIDATTVTNMTFTPGTSNLVLQPTANLTQSTFCVCSTSVVWGHVTVASFLTPGSTEGTLVFPGTNFTIGTLSINAPNKVIFTNGGTITVTNPVTWAGTSGTSSINISNSTDGIAGTAGSVALAAGSTMNWATFNTMTFTGSPVASNSFNLGRNTGITINPPGGGGCIIGGWLLWRDMPENINDNFPAWLEKAA